VDGNKRTALATAEVFLLVNDLNLSAANPEVEELTFRVADGRAGKDEVIAFFRKHVTPLAS
jgi:death-on-curing protein